MLYENCEKYWWTNLLYINNLYPWANLDECMPWTWYLSSEIQFYVAAPLMIVPLSIIYPVGLVIVALFLVANVVVIGAITGRYELSAGIFFDIDASANAENIVPEGHNSLDDIHIKPWTRIGPFVLGILLGFILFKKLKPSFGKLINSLFFTSLWIVGPGLCFATVYGTHGSYEDQDSLTEGEEVVYQMFSRLCWSSGVGILIYLCHNGYGGFVNNFLSMKIWTPLSRLSLLTYLVHPVVLFVLLYTRREPVYHTDVTIAVYTIATVVLSYGVAGLVALFVDLPLRRLENTILKMTGFGGHTEKESAQNEFEQEMEEGDLMQQNYTFRELDKEDQKQMEMGEGEADSETTAKELLKI